MILPVASKIEAPVNIQAKAVQVGVGLPVGALGCLCSVILTKYWFGGGLAFGPLYRCCLATQILCLPCIGGSMTKLLVRADAARYIHIMVCTAAPRTQLWTLTCAFATVDAVRSTSTHRVTCPADPAAEAHI